MRTMTHPTRRRGRNAHGRVGVRKPRWPSPLPMDPRLAQANENLGVAIRALRDIEETTMKSKTGAAAKAHTIAVGALWTVG